MAKQDKSSRSGFVIKLSNETALKLAEEEQQAKIKAEQRIAEAVSDIESKEDDKISADNTHSDAIQDSSVEVSTAEKTSKQETSNLKTIENKGSDLKEGEIKESGSEKSAPETADHPSESTSTSWGEYTPYITYEGEDAIYTDPTTKQRYSWNKDTNAWDAKESDTNKVYSYENDTHIYTEADGSKFFWDDGKKAWIPKVDDDFLAFYQMSYGFVDNKATEKKNDEKLKEEKEKLDTAKTGVKRKNDPQWFEQSEEKNTKVYVSNLPLDLTEEEFVNFMQKCGLVERDPHSQKMKVKLYMDKEQNCFKGDALCTYIKIESVDLALKLLDGGDFKGNKVKVEKAHFELKGKYNPSLKPKKKKKKELEKIKKMQQKLFDWRPEKFIGERSKHERIVILKNLFHPTDFDTEVQLILDYQQDLREEAVKCGEVKKVVLYDRHPEGVAQITMKEPEQADAVVELMNGRWFGKRQITAEIWDGRTKYRIAETDADLSKRTDKWEKFLEGKEDDKKTAEEKKDAKDISQESDDKTAEEKKDAKDISQVSDDKTAEEKKDAKDISQESDDKTASGMEVDSTTSSTAEGDTTPTTSGEIDAT